LGARPHRKRREKETFIDSQPRRRGRTWLAEKGLFCVNGGQEKGKPFGKKPRLASFEPTGTLRVKKGAHKAGMGHHSHSVGCQSSTRGNVSGHIDKSSKERKRSIWLVPQGREKKRTPTHIPRLTRKVPEARQAV